MENAIDLKDIIRRLTVETKFAPILLEKDYHLTRILHRVVDLVKINESKQFTKDDLIEFIKELNFKVAELNEKEIDAVIKTDERIDVKEMAQLIVEKFNF